LTSLVVIDDVNKDDEPILEPVLELRLLEPEVCGGTGPEVVAWVLEELDTVGTDVDRLEVKDDCNQVEDTASVVELTRWELGAEEDGDLLELDEA